MDLRKIKKLVEILEESGLSELEVQENGESVRLARAIAVQPSVHYAPAPATAPAASPTPPPPEPTAVTTEADAGMPEGVVVRAPMVGTFYSRPAPDASPFVSVGDRVQVGDPLCVIEAMKMFNQLEAEVEGEVVKILVEDAQPIEFDQPLFVVR